MILYIFLISLAAIPVEFAVGGALPGWLSIVLAELCFVAMSPA
jgi:hypothetical protein